MNLIDIFNSDFFNQFFDFWLVKDIIRPVLDVLLLAFLIYRGYLILQQTRAVQLIKGVQLIALFFVIALIFRLNTLSWLFQNLFPGLLIGLAIIFQPELRKIFTQIGQRNWFRARGAFKRVHLESIVNSVEVLSLKKIGSIIVLARQVGLKNVIDTGTVLNAELSSSLILTIFTLNSPLHDGALIIREDRIIAAGCFLPLTEQQDIKKSFGARHRAALGLAEETDAVVLVVSEETGSISLAYNARLYYDISQGQLLKSLFNIFELKNDEEQRLEDLAE